MRPAINQTISVLQLFIIVFLWVLEINKIILKKHLQY